MISSDRRPGAILLIGPTGAGKTPVGDHIEKKGLGDRKCHHFDFGHQLRAVAENDSPPEGFGNDDHLFIREVLDKGLLLENEHFPVAEKIINLFIRKKNVKKDDLLVLNGLPRHIDQAKDLGDLVTVKRLVVLECSAGHVYERIRTNTGSDRTGRTDDSVQMIRAKLEIFKNRTTPLIDYYANIGSDVFRIKVTASSTAEHVYTEILTKSGNKNR